MQFDEKFIQNYKEVIIGLIIIAIVALLGIKQISDVIMKTQNTLSEHKKQEEKLKEAKKKLEDFEKTKQKMLDKQNKLKPVFEQKQSPEDSIASFGGMFEDIVDYVKMNGLMLRSVEYKLNPADDTIYATFPTLYNVCQVNIFVVGTYTQMEGFMRDLTVYPYFINIASMDISPYEKDKQYLLVNISITLYSKKQQGAASVMQ